MTENQAIYRSNCRQCIAMGIRLEQLTEEADYYEKSSDEHSLYSCVVEIEEIRKLLNEAWDEQIDLFFQIKIDFKMHQRFKMNERLYAKETTHTKYIAAKYKKIYPNY